MDQLTTRLHVGAHIIWIGDCLDRLSAMPAASVDVVVTSPPYNLGQPYRSYDDSKPRAEYLSWMREVGRALKRVMRDDAALFLNTGSTNTDPWLAGEIAGTLRDLLRLQNHIIWVKSMAIGETTHGHFKPVTSKRFLNHTHEAIWHFTQTGDLPIDRLAIGVPFMDKSNIARRGHDQDKRCAGNTWFIPYPTAQTKADKYHHPAAFPVGLPARCLRLHGVRPGMVVLDPFAGTGSTLVAAAGLGCQGIGIDLDPEYCRIAEERLRVAMAIAAPQPLSDPGP